MQTTIRFWLYAAGISMLGFLSGGCPILNECEAFDGYDYYGLFIPYATVEQDTTDPFSFSFGDGPGIMGHIMLTYTSCEEPEMNYSTDLYFEMDTALAFGDTMRFEDSALAQIDCVYGIDLFGITDLGYESMQPVTEGYISYYKVFDASIGDTIWRVDLDVLVNDIITPPGKIHFQYVGELYY